MLPQKPVIENVDRGPWSSSKEYSQAKRIPVRLFMQLSQRPKGSNTNDDAPTCEPGVGSACHPSKEPSPSRTIAGDALGALLAHTLTELAAVRH